MPYTVLLSPTVRIFLASIALICDVGSLSLQSEAQQLTLHRDDGYVSAATISPDGSHLVLNMSKSVQNENGTWNNSEAVEFLNAADMKVVSTMTLQGAEGVTNAPLASSFAFVQYCDEGKYVVSYNKTEAIYVVDPTSFHIQRKINLGLRDPHSEQDLAPGGNSQVQIGCSAGSDIIAVAASGGGFGAGFVRLFSLTDGKQTAAVRLAPASAVLQSISLSPSGSRIAFTFRDTRSVFRPLKEANVEVRDTKDLNVTNRFSTGNPVKSIAFSGETEIATLPFTKQGLRGRLGIQLWDAASGKQLRTLSDAHADVQAPISASADGAFILAYVPDLHECALCNGFEGRTDVTAQRVAVWKVASGDQTFRSVAFGPLMPHISPQCVLSQDGKSILLFWPFASTNVKVLAAS